jgi:hypothetical protein
VLFVVLVLWTGVFVHFDLNFGLGIDLVLVLLIIKSLRDAGKAERDGDS